MPEQELRRLNEILNQLTVTVAKLTERVDMMLKHNDKLEDRVKDLEDKPDIAALEQRVLALEKGMSTNDSDKRWVVFLIVGAVIGAILKEIIK